MFKARIKAHQGQNRLDRLWVASLVVGEYQDRLRLHRTHECQIRRIRRVARSANHTSAARSTGTGPNLVFHLDLVARSKDNHARVALVLVGNLDLGEDLMQLWRPAKNQRVPLFHDQRTSLAQLIELAINAGADQSDQGRQHKDASNRHQQCDDSPRPILICTKRAFGEREHQTRPDALKKAGLAFVGSAEAEQ